MRETISTDADMTTPADADTTASADADTPISSRPPPSPEGYADPYEFEYPTAVLLLGSSFLGIVSSVVFVALLWLIQGPEVFGSVYDVTTEEGTTTFAMDVTVVAVPFLVALIGTIVVHELIHGTAFTFYGYDVEYGVVPAMGAFYTVVVDRFQTREKLFRVCLAPLVVITLVCVPLLAVPIPIVALTAVFVLILNTSGAVGDLYAAWRLLRMPSKTLLYDVDPRHSYVYEPLER